MTVIERYAPFVEKLRASAVKEREDLQPLLDIGYYLGGNDAPEFVVELNAAHPRNARARVQLISGSTRGNMSFEFVWYGILGAKMTIIGNHIPDASAFEALVIYQEPHRPVVVFQQWFEDPRSSDMELTSKALAYIGDITDRLWPNKEGE